MAPPLRPNDDDDRDQHDDRPAHPTGRAIVFVSAVMLLIVVLAVVSTLQQT